MTVTPLEGLFGGIREIWNVDPDATLRTKIMRACYRLVATVAYQIGVRLPVSSKPVPETKSEHSITTSRSDDKVAVVIPVYASTVDKCHQVISAVESVVGQHSLIPDVLIVVDDASPICDGVAWKEEIMNIGRNFATEIQLIEFNQNCGAASARNEGLRIAEKYDCDIVCLMDADCVADPHWVQQMVKAQQKNGGIIGGMTFALNNYGQIGDYHNVSGTLNGRKLPDGTLLYACTCNMSIKISAVQDLKFDELFPGAAYEDVDFCLEARKNNVSVLHEASAIMQHDFDVSIAGLFKEFQRYGRSEELLLQKHPYYLDWHETSTSILAVPVKKDPRIIYSGSELVPSAIRGLCPRRSSRRLHEYPTAFSVLKSFVRNVGNLLPLNKKKRLV